MLLNNFFYIDSLQQNEQFIGASISINTNHAILQGHFPQQAVVPGVCMIEMLKETIQKSMDKTIQLESASMVKFLTMFAPPQFTKANFEINLSSIIENKFLVSAQLKFEETIFLKFKGIFTLRTL